MQKIPPSALTHIFKQTNFHLKTKNTSTIIKIIVGTILTLMFWNNIVYATNPVSIQDLQSLKVSNASEKPSSTIDIPAEIYSITDRDIERSGLTSIPELLRLAPGLHVTQLNSNSWSIASRGFNTELGEKIAVMIDGRKVHSALFPSIFWENQDLVLSDIKRIDVVRGTSANVAGDGGLSKGLWTDNALNGVINIITKRAAETQGKLINIIHGNEESIQSARYGGKVGDDLFYRVYVKNRIIDSAVNIHNAHAGNDWGDMRTGFKIDWEDSISDQLTLQGDLGKMEDKGRYIYPSSDLSGRLNNIIRDESRSGNIMAKWLHRQDNGNRLTSKSYYDYYKRSFALFQQKFDIFDLDLQYFVPKTPFGVVTLGLGYRITNSKIDYSDQYDFKFKKNSSGLLNSFIQSKIDIIPKKLSLTTSLKLQHEDDLKNNEYSNFALHPSIRGNFKITDSQSIWSGISKITRSPTIAERYGSTIKSFRDETPNVVMLSGNENFKPEELVSYELGYRNRFSKKLFTDLSIFFNKYDNIRTYETDSVSPSETRYVLGNELYGESYGAEISSKISLTDNLDISVNYTFLKLDLRLKDGSTDTETESDEKASPQNQFSVRSYYNFFGNFSWNNLLFYVDELKKYDINSYFRFDSNVSWKINQHIKLTIAGQNLFSSKRQEFIPFMYQEVNFMEPNKIYAKLNIAF
ncbi:MAG: iron complex outermembrane receptor protein [Ulvibacter sp.]|jgi:iron complex outermembrane receptor protein